MSFSDSPVLPTLHPSYPSSFLLQTPLSPAGSLPQLCLPSFHPFLDRVGGQGEPPGRPEWSSAGLGEEGGSAHSPAVCLFVQLRDNKRIRGSEGAPSPEGPEEPGAQPVRCGSARRLEQWLPSDGILHRFSRSRTDEPGVCGSSPSLHMKIKELRTQGPEQISLQSFYWGNPKCTKECEISDACWRTALHHSLGRCVT